MPYHICLWRCIYVNTCSLIPSATGTTQFIVYCSVNVLFYSIQKSNSTTLIYLHEPINGSYITPWLIFTIPYQNLEIKNVSTDHLRDCQQFTFQTPPEFIFICSFAKQLKWFCMIPDISDIFKMRGKKCTGVSFKTVLSYIVLSSANP